MAANTTDVDAERTISPILKTQGPAEHENGSNPQPPSQTNLQVETYFKERSEAFREVLKEREAGWKTPAADAHYQSKRVRNMNVSSGVQEGYKNMYRKLANEMDRKTGALKLPHPEAPKQIVLHLCMAPGGFTKYTIDKNPHVMVYGITLSKDEGGHELLLDKDDRDKVTIEELDMNLMIGEVDLGISNIAPHHPDYERFREEWVFEGQSFQIVLADGAVLDTHERARKRQDRDLEGLRLCRIQLIFGLKRLEPGGTFIILLHQIDSWDNLELLSTFEKFSKIQIFKSEHDHTHSASFYLVAKNVRPGHAAAKKLLQDWKEKWVATTFTEEELIGTTPKAKEPTNGDVEQLLEEYGPTLIDFGIPVWKIQAEALKNHPPWKKNGRHTSNRGRTDGPFTTNWRSKPSSTLEQSNWIAGSKSGTEPSSEPKLQENHRPDPRILTWWRKEDPK